MSQQEQEVKATFQKIREKLDQIQSEIMEMKKILSKGGKSP